MNFEVLALKIYINFDIILGHLIPRNIQRLPKNTLLMC